MDAFRVIQVVRVNPNKDISTQIPTRFLISGSGYEFIRVRVIRVRVIWIRVAFIRVRYSGTVKKHTPIPKHEFQVLAILVPVVSISLILCLKHVNKLQWRNG